MKKILFFATLFFLAACSDDAADFSSNPSTPFDYRDFAMGDFKIDISRSYRFINPNVSSYTPINELNLRVYRSTYQDDELIIKGIRGQCVYAYMTNNQFSFSSIETNLEPEDFGFEISCYNNCKIYMSGSGSVSELERGNRESPFKIDIKFSYDGFDLVRYSGSKSLDLPRPVLEADDC